MNTNFLLCHACFHIPALSTITLISGRYSRVIFMHTTVNSEKDGNANLERLHASLCFAKNHKNNFIGYHYPGICRNRLCGTFRYVYVVKGVWSLLTVLLFKRLLLLPTTPPPRPPPPYSILNFNRFTETSPK